MHYKTKIGLLPRHSCTKDIFMYFWFIILLCNNCRDGIIAILCVLCIQNQNYQRICWMSLDYRFLCANFISFISVLLSFDINETDISYILLLHFLTKSEVQTLNCFQLLWHSNEWTKNRRNMSSTKNLIIELEFSQWT